MLIILGFLDPYHAERLSSRMVARRADLTEGVIRRFGPTVARLSPFAESPLASADFA